MRLIKKEEINYMEVICMGSLSSYEENKPLAKLLSKIIDISNNNYLLEQHMKNFSKGLLHSFYSEGLIDKDLNLTPVGNAVVKEEHAWKELKGMFKLAIVRKRESLYVVDFELCKNISQGFEKKEVDFSKVLHGEYQNNNGMKIKDIKLEPNIYIGNYKEEEIECEYDYETEKNSYALNINNIRIQFPDNEKTFKLIKNNDAEDMLKEAIVNYENFSVEDTKVILNKEKGGTLFEGALKQIFEDGEFEISSSNQDYKIEGIVAYIVNSKVAENVFLKYMLKKAEERYCGYSEVASLLSAFYDLFENCVDVGTKTQNLYTELIKMSACENKTAYLRLKAYEDLQPDKIQSNYQMKTTIDWTNEKHSIDELVDKIIWSTNVKSVTMLTKYSYRNAATSRAIGLLAKSIKRKCNAKLSLITCVSSSDKEQTDVAKEFFDKLRNNDNINLMIKDPKKIEKIHDRYYRVETNDGQINWMKMTGELDAFKYEGDFKDRVTPNLNITEKTIAKVKELTIVAINEKGVPAMVKKVMEGNK